MSIILFQIKLPHLDELFQLLRSIRSSLMYNIFGTFSQALCVMTVLKVTDGGGAGFTQMALAALHTGLMGTERFKWTAIAKQASLQSLKYSV